MSQRRSRRQPRVCQHCGAPMTYEGDNCWRCDELWQDPHGGGSAQAVQMTERGAL
jgi:predicted amidophosphoribosyltransferase